MLTYKSGYYSYLSALIYGILKLLKQAVHQYNPIINNYIDWNIESIIIIWAWPFGLKFHIAYFKNK